MRSQAGQLLELLADKLNIPPGKYKEAVERYNSVGDYLDKIDDFEIEIYSQGSFRLGTAIRPWKDNAEADYDVDIVSEVDAEKHDFHYDSRNLKDLIGDHLKASGIYGKMLDQEGKRCWTLKYNEADGIGFHIDILPAIPEDKNTLDNIRIAKDAIAITDRDNGIYTWRSSNPKGYSTWFDGRVHLLPEYQSFKAAEQRRIASSDGRKYASVENVPDALVRAPLRRVIQLLKRHRDIVFSGKANEKYKPISMIITTLAAILYNGETDVYSALSGIVQKLSLHAGLLDDSYYLDKKDKSLAQLRLITKTSDGKWEIKNPVNRLENFADRWHLDDDARAIAFFDWVVEARRDLLLSHSHEKPVHFVSRLKNVFGESLIDGILNNINPAAPTFLSTSSQEPSFLSVSHKQQPKWEIAEGRKNIVVVSGLWTKRGFRPRKLSGTPDDRPLEKHGELTYEAKTNVEKPFDVYWQVVNTGSEASLDKQLRGDFYDNEPIARGDIRRTEKTKYSGTHWVECFIVKNDRCVARSGEFLINIR